MKFSFIIPCYNAEEYLKECLDSILNQTFQDWEMILINDGSTDHTEEIICNYEKKDSRIRIFNQENQGVSATRNDAVKRATGDFLIFVDSDDWYKDEGCLDQIAKALDQVDVDILVFRYQIMQDKNSFSKIRRLQYFELMNGYVYTGEEYLLNVLSKGDVYQWFPWLYAFKREFWNESQIKFDKNLWILEDVDIIYRVILKAQKVKILNKVVYQYRQREGSAVHILSMKSVQERLSVCKNNIEAVNHMDINKKLKKLLNSNFACTYFNVLAKIDCLEKSDRRAALSLLRENSYIMNYTIRKKNIFIRRLTYILGLRMTARLLLMRSLYMEKK